MTKGNEDRHWQGGERDALNSELNAALANYAAVEPRTGLEQRILANLQSQRASHDTSWWWGAALAVAAIIVVSVALAWRADKSSPSTVAIHPSPARSGPQRSEASELASKIGGGIRPANRTPPLRKSGHQSRTSTVAVAAPKLDQFPSPRPLSEQEKILASYVAEYPERAVLVARAQAEMLRQDQTEEMQKSPGGHDNDLLERNQ